MFPILLYHYVVMT